MNEPGTQKVGIGAEDLTPEGSLMALAHPDSQGQMYRGQAMANEKIPRDLEIVESLATSEDPFVGFVRGEKRVYLTERALGAEVMAGLDKGRSLAIDGEGGTWGKVPASEVRKKHGGYSFGSRMGAPAAASDTDETEPATQPAATMTAPTAQGAPLEVAPPSRPEATEQPEAVVQVGVEGGSPVAGASDPATASLEAGGPDLPKAVIPFLETKRVLGPPAQALPMGGGGIALPVSWPTGGVREVSGAVDRKGPQVTLAMGHRPRALAPGAAGRSYDETPSLGGLPWWAGVGLLAAGIFCVLGTGGLSMGQGPKTFRDYLKWERTQLLREISRKQFEHDRHVGLRKSGDDLRVLEAEEREIAAMVEGVEVLDGRIR